MLEVRRNTEVSKDQNKDEEVVDGQSQFQDIAGGEELSIFWPAPGGEQEGEADGQRNPDHTPGDGFFEAGRLVGLLLEDAEVEREHQAHEA